MGWADNYINQLKNGQSVTFCPRGNSMEPRVRNGERVTCIPPSQLGHPLQKDDVVLCTVSGRQYLHLIKAVDDTRYQIGNNRGFINGWTRRIHGVMIND